MSFSHSWQHFTGTRGGKRTRRKGKGLSKKQRTARRGTHENKYEHLSQAKPNDPADKTYRDLAIQGHPGQVFARGSTVLWHGRRYELQEGVMIPEAGVITMRCKRTG
ncbi:hypothetical protein HY629_02730 [Candidatus Uhrbacteria bacterium]|nr:hypothetical protein [Candidatus Uhrbacteria bacterium]